MSKPRRFAAAPSRDSFSGLERRACRWLEFEQTVNERLSNDAVYTPIDQRSNTVRPHLYPEQRLIWNQALVWIPERQARRYGPVDATVRAALGVRPRTNAAPLFLHPQPPIAHVRFYRQYGGQPLAGLAASSTSSYRSVVVWRRNGAGSPAILKLSLGAIVGKIRRALREKQIARAVVISSIFDTIPDANRERLGVDWFAEPAGVAETRSRHGWLLRRMPRLLSQPGATSLLPVFSLISARGREAPLLVALIKRSRQTPERFVVETLLRPYIDALAYLLFEEGLQYEGHPQNVLLEIDRHDRPTGRIVLRDLSDTTVNIAFRVAKGKPLPMLPAAFLPRRCPFWLSSNAADYGSNFNRPRICRGYDTVELYGLRSFVWAINRSLVRFFPGYDSSLVGRRYLELWQQAAIERLHVKPLFGRRPLGIATDEAVAYFLRHIDWSGHGAAKVSLPDAAEPLLLMGPLRRQRGRAYDRVSCAWGSLFLSEGLPAFFLPAY